jgi:DNA primase
MIANSIIDEVRARADIVEIIGESVPLKRAGKEFRALCPFHHEKTPSFYVVPAKGFYNCFGCGASGDVFDFVMKRTGATFIEAVRQIADKIGVEIPADSAGPQEEPNRALYAAIAFAADFFTAQLADPGGEAARRYLVSRGIADTAVERFLLGFAPDEWRALRDAAHRHGIDDAILVAAGLIKESENADEPYDRFRNRIIFPIADVSGRLVAFGGRALRPGENVVKYLNSPETPIYHKGEMLYGLNWSRPAIRREGAVLVVEGYMDYVSLAARGIENVVAGMGTALTAEQANLIARYTAKANLLYDSDRAGLKATFRSADALLRAGVHPLVVTLPPGEDPDSLVRKGGEEAIRPLIAAAVDVVDRKLKILEDRGYFTDIDGTRRALDGLLPTIRATIDTTLRDIYIDRIAERTGVRRETLEHEVNAAGERSASPWRVSRARHTPARPARSAASHSAESNGAAAAERLLLLLLIRDPARIAQAAAVLRPEDLRDETNRELFLALHENGPDALRAEPGRLSANGALRFSELQRDPTEMTDADQIFEDTVTDLKEVRGLFRRLDDIDSRLAGTDDEAAQFAIMREKMNIKHETREIASEMGYKTIRRIRRPPTGRTGQPGEPSTDER